jgi:molybdopterin converting factor small subunit
MLPFLLLRWPMRGQHILQELRVKVMRISVALYGAARVVIGQPQVDVSFDTSTATLAQALQQLAAAYPRAQPYFLDEAGRLPSFVRVLINHIRPDPDATLATVLHDEDQVALLVAVAGGEQ